MAENKKDTALIQAQIINITRQFLTEMKRERALRSISLEAKLERDLGIDSLGRVELFHRIEESFGVTLNESVMAQADTLNELVNALEHAKKGSTLTFENKISALEAAEFDPSKAAHLVEILHKRAINEPDRPHIYFQDEKGEEKIITYKMLFENAKKIAAGFSEYDIHPGETIAVMLPSSEEFFYVFMGILLMGAIPVPIYPPFKPDRIEEYAIREAAILKNAEVRLLITFQQAERLSELLRVFIPSLKAVLTFDMLNKSSKKPKLPTIQADMPALIQYTSGSTSLPKGVLLTHTNLLANIRAAGEAIQIKPSDVAVSWLPLYHDMGLIGAWFVSFYYAMPVVIMSPLTFLTRPERWLWAIHYHRATLSAAPNFAYELCVRRIKDAALQGLDLSSWRLTFNGAEAVNPKTIANFTRRFAPFGFKPETMFPVYGLAESCVALTFGELNSPPKIDIIDREIFETEQRAVPATNEENVLQFVVCGKAIPRHEIRVVDNENNLVPERVIGNLQFRGPSTMQGYYRQVEATQAVMRNGWVNTGDLAYLVEGEVVITGRKKDIIIKAGRNLHPEEIEDVTSQVTGVRKGCVVALGASDERSGTEKLVVVVETTEKNEEIRKKMRHDINEKISVVLGIVPDEVVLVPPRTIPKTSSGKLQRSATKIAYTQNTLLRARWPLWTQLIKLFIKGAGIKIAHWASMLFRTIYTAYVAALIVVSTIYLYLSVFILPYKLATTLSKYWARCALWAIGCPLTVDGIDKLKENNQAIYIANHSSYIDSIVLLAVLPTGVRFVGKKELLKVPILSTIIKKLKHLTVDRVDFSANLSDTKKIIDTLKEGNSIAIFPEGTFTYATGLRAFKMGAFKVATETLTPICPVAMRGTREILRGDEYLFKPGAIKVTIGDYIKPSSQDWEATMALHTAAREIIAKNCGEQMIDF